MNEDLATKEWADHHGQVSDGIAKAIRAIADTLRVLHEQQFSAPWRQDTSGGKSAKC